MPERAREPFLLGPRHLSYERLVVPERRVRVAERRHHDVDDRIHHGALDPERSGVRDHPAQHPPQDVAASLVRRLDAIRDQERGGPAVFGDDLQGRVVAAVPAVRAARQGLRHLQQRPEQVRLEDAVHVLEHHRHALQGRARVDVLRGEGLDEPELLVDPILDEDEVPDLHEPFLVRVRAALRSVLGSAIDEDLAARTARAGRVGVPVVRELALRIRHPPPDDAVGDSPTPSTQPCTASSSSSNTVTQSRSWSIPIRR